MKDSVYIIPAIPGMYKIYGTVTSAGELGYFKWPVVAWRITDSHDGEYTTTQAVCAGCTDDSSRSQDNEAILFPCGTVVVEEIEVFDSVQKWQESCKERFDSI